ncbi:hypothetical protein JX266_009429 [Neoarthrinium moseri]|nr:hypothetical protein JX266_009429 [Neoarthrinium moseri]
MSSRRLGSDASRQSRPSSRAANVARPLSSDNRLNNDGGFTAGSTPARKRKHDAYAMEDLLKPSIVVKAYPTKLSIKPRSLQPLMLLPRERLGLSCLDLAAPSGEFEYAQFYESTIRILDLESRMGTRPIVLIARLESNRMSYVLERQDSGLYTLCKLGNWVDLEKLSSHATVAYTKLIRPRSNPAHASMPEATTTPELHKENKKRRLAIEAIQSLVKRPARSLSISLPSQAPEAAQVPTAVEQDVASQTLGPPSGLSPAEKNPDLEAMAATQLTKDPVPEQPSSQHTADDIFDNVRSHYFEALYHSMIDKKYRETVPDIIAKFKTHIAESADEQGPKAKKRKSKKMKLGKDSLYPAEDQHVRRWWDVRKPQAKDDDSMAAEAPQDTKLQVSCLRSRETQLQIILILEILALEPLRSAANANESQLPGLPADEPATEASKETTSKKRNKHNYPVLLDVHADRLSIWQSTSLDDIKMLEDSQAGQSNTAQKSNGTDSDPLKDFCIEIIVPFFSSRLPQQCDSLTRKLGGPVMPSPPKPKPRKTEAPTKPRAKPGMITKRATAPKPGRTLDRVLSKETEQHRRSMSRGPSSVIALMRSASTPIPMLKREPSDVVSLTAAPRRDSKDATSARDKSSGSSSAVGKRVTQEDKARRDAEIKAELQEAISSLRKPNREVVGKAMAEADERRATTSLSQLRKSKKPTEHTGFHNVIKATPVGPRFRNALARDAYSQPNMGIIHESIEGDHVPSSSSQRLVPSSAPRKRNRDGAFLVEESSPALPTMTAPVDLVGATPARPSFLKRGFLSAPGPDEGLVLASSPIAERKFLALPGSSLRHRDSGIGMPSSPDGGLAETPVKRPPIGRMGSLEGFVTVTPAKKRATDNIVAAPAEQEVTKGKDNNARMSIFERLGWDDDFDDMV